MTTETAINTWLDVLCSSSVDVRQQGVPCFSRRTQKQYVTTGDADFNGHLPVMCTGRDDNVERIANASDLVPNLMTDQGFAYGLRRAMRTMRAFFMGELQEQSPHGRTPAAALTHAESLAFGVIEPTEADRLAVAHALAESA